MNEIDGVACGTPGCDNRGKPGLNLVGYGSFATKSGRRQRYRCTVCRGTLSTNTGTAYSGLRCTRREVDHVASLRVEGVSISATARVTGHSRNTVARWLERASTAARHFNDRMVRDLTSLSCRLMSLHVRWRQEHDGLGCLRPSRYPPGCGPGESWAAAPIATPEPSSATSSAEGESSIAPDRHRWLRVLRRGDSGLFGSACVYGQVLKTRRNNRVVRVERRVKIGTATRLKAALWASEDSETLNTSFVERLNLTIRQGSAYLRRRSPCHARCEEPLRGHVELLRCHYNFGRPHRALKFGRETRTPAMQAGVISTRLHWSDIFTARSLSTLLCGGRAHSRDRPAQRTWHSRAADVLVAVRTTNGCLINSERHKHPPRYTATDRFKLTMPSRNHRSSRAVEIVRSPDRDVSQHNDHPSSCRRLR